MKKLVSVVITTHNREARILKEAIDSVIEQTYTPIELLVINDSPEYEGRKEIDELINSYRKDIIYRINPNSGANISRNFGANLASGEYLSFLDDDDYWDKTRIEKIVSELNKGVDVVYHDIIMFNEKETRRIDRFPISEDKLLERILYSNDWGGFSSVAMTKAAFIDAGKLDEKVKSQQDTDLWIRLAKKCKVSYIHQPLTFYRISNDAISSNENKKLEGLMYLLNKYNDLYLKYQNSKSRKLRDELILFTKNGWFGSGYVIFNELQKCKGYIYAVCIFVFGLLKFVAVKLKIKKAGKEE